MCAEQEMALDARILTFMRWDLPQTELLQDKLKTSIFGDTSYEFASFQNYHYISVDKFPPTCINDTQYKEDCDTGVAQIFASAHRVMGTKRAALHTDCAGSDNSGLYIQQSLTLLGEPSSFWATQPDLMFISLIHLKDGISPSLPELKKKIKNLKPDLANNFSLYHTADFCDVVLFAREIAYTEYQDLIWLLTVDLSTNINDTVSLFCVGRNYLVTALANMDTPKYSDFLKNFSSPWKTQDQISISIDICLQDVTKWKELKAKFIDIFPANINRITGRNDVRINFENISLGKLLCIIHILDSAVFDNCLLSYEIIPLGPDQDANYINVLPTGKENRDNGFCNIILDCKNKYQTAATAFYPHPFNRYLRTPSEELYRSLQTLDKNGFADEFILSVLPSLIEYTNICSTYADAMNTPQSFWDDLTTDTQDSIDIRIRQKEEIQSSLETLRKDYFQALSMLAQCTMHGERQFMQSPAFNCTAFDVPPKLLALYSAAAYWITQALNDTEKRTFSFLITPGFRDDIYVKPISKSLGSKDREISHPHKLSIIYLNEKLFYEPNRLLFLLCHEIAHYVGDSSRNRQERTASIFLSVSMYLVCKTLPLIGDKDTLDKLMKSLAIALSEILLDYYNSFTPDSGQTNYITDLSDFLVDRNAVSLLFQSPLEKQKIKSKLVSNLETLDDDTSLLFVARLQDTTLHSCYIQTLLQKQSTRKAALDIMADNIVLKMSTEIYSWFHLGDDNVAKSFYSFCQTLLQAYSEAYSDCRMIELFDFKELKDYDELATYYFEDTIDAQKRLRYLAVTEAYYPETFHKSTKELDDEIEQSKLLCMCQSESNCNQDLQIEYALKFAQQQICSYLMCCDKLSITNDVTTLRNFVTKMKRSDLSVFESMHNMLTKYRCDLLMHTIAK